MEQINVTLFNRNKGLFLGILTCCICAVIAIFLPHLFHHPSNTVFFFSGVVFIILPLISFVYISKKCLKQALLTYDGFGFKLQKNEDEYSLAVDWKDVAFFRMQPFRIMIGKGIKLNLYYSAGKSSTLYLFGIDISRETANRQSFIYTFFRSVNRYNLQVTLDKKVMLLPGFFATESGKYLMGIPVLLVVLDFYYRLSRPLESNKEMMFFFFAAAMATGFWGQVLKERKSFERLSKMQDDIE